MTPEELVKAARLATVPARGEWWCCCKGVLSQEALARRLGTTQPAISMVEIGKKVPTPEFVARVLAACKLPEGWRP